MGSGHFLARATDFLAEAIATDPYIESPLELTEESELTYYRRRVVESCIYGVDLNPLAVELAKLTLWLTTMAKSKPLSFLNHHLRVGNSLIGARVADLDEIPKAKGKKKVIDLSRAPVQLGLFQSILNKKLYDLLQNRALIAKLPTETLEDVHNKQKWEKDFEHNMERFRILADVWISTYFGNNVAWDEYNTLIENLQSPDVEWGKLVQKKNIQQALALSAEKHFFHWELEFPEVFFDEQGNRRADAGFDAVVGNPPYVDSEEMTKSHMELREYCTEQWNSASGNWDLFVVFVELGLTLIRTGGYSSLIVPNKLLGAEYSIAAQSLIKAKRPIAIRDYSQAKVFEADVYPIVYLVQSSARTEIDNIAISIAIKTKSGQLNITGETQINLRVLNTLPEGYWWPIFSANIQLLAKAIEVSKPLAEYATITGGSSVSESYKLVELLKSLDDFQVQEEHFVFVNTGTIDRYELLWDVTSTQYIKKTYQKPVISQAALLKEMPVRYNQSRSAKLILAGMVKVLEGIYDPDGVMLAGKSTVLIIDSLLSLSYILAMLNSKLLTLLCKELFGSLALAGGFLSIGPPQAERLPIRRINFITPDKERKQLLEQAKKLYQKYLDSQDWDKMLAFVSERLPTKEDDSPDTEHEQSDVIHDLLAFLAEEMTRLNKEKQAKIRSLLTWLEKEILKGSIEDQKNKTKIKDFHNNTFEDLLDVLKKNKVVPDPCPANVRDTIAGEFSAAVNALTPLKACIKATNDLIDQIVYKLYGLTDDEIAIVEG